METPRVAARGVFESGKISEKTVSKKFSCVNAVKSLQYNQAIVRMKQWKQVHAGEL